MSQARRINDRRRRVLYTTHQTADEDTSAAQRRATAKLREARRPTAAYGARVNRRLRGRWFSLVPIKRRSLTAFVFVVASMCIGLSIMHHLAVTWPPLATADRFEVARPFLLDRHDSLGRWLIATIYALTAGTMLLVYQLRRYRNDDFQGHYRLWRLALVVTLITSIDSLVGLVSWTGALLDVGIGKRVALQGGDWLRILCSFAGAIFALRLMVEVRRSRAALLAMGFGWAWFAIPVAARWHLMPIDTVNRLTLVSTAPLLACGCFWISTVIYLRMLVREVRGIQDDGPSIQKVRDYASQWKASRLENRPPSKRERASKFSEDSKPSIAAKVTARATPAVTEPSKSDSSSRPTPAIAPGKNETGDAKPKRSWFGRKKNEKSSSESTREGRASKQTTDKQPTAKTSTSSEETNEKNKRSAFGWLFGGGSRGRSKKQDADKATQKRKQTAVQSDKQTGDQSATETPRRSRFSFRLQPKTRSQPVTTGSEAKTAAEQTKPADHVAKKAAKEDDATKPSGLRGWLGRRKSKEAEDTGEKKVEPGGSYKPTAKVSSATSAARNSVANDEPNEQLDETSVDWSSMSKSERRRMRKQLKRQGRAA